MGKKKILRISKIASIKCPNCSVISRRKVPDDSSPGFFDCDKCNNRLIAPVTQCCIICAFTNKRCVPSLKMQARIKGLELR